MTDQKVRDLLTSPIDMLYLDPISPSTRKAGWILSSASFASVCVLVFKFSPTQILGVTIPQPLNTGSLDAVVLIVVLGLTFPYAFKIVAEIMRKKEEDHLLASKIASRKVVWLRQIARDEADVSSSPPDYDEQPDEFFYKKVNAFQAQVAENEVKSMNKILNATIANKFRNLRFWTTLWMPLMISMLALWIGRTHLLQGIISVYQTL